MSDIKDIPIQELGSENSGENCAANEPFALRILDSSMSPEFEVDHIIIIDPPQTWMSVGPQENCQGPLS